MNEQEKYDWMVYVNCLTFNHARYIVDSMNGFTMQETNFPFVCGIIDDASTDGEQEVIKKYLNEKFDLEDKNVVRHEETEDYVLTFARHKTNINCHFVVLYLKYNHYSVKKSKLPYVSQWRDNAKYHALCEGDDYWIDKNKLQRQFDIMTLHPEYSMCAHNAILWLVDTNRVETFYKEAKEGILDQSDIINEWIIPTASTFYRSEIPYPNWLAKIYSGDFALILRCMNYGPIYFIDDIMSVYRRSFVGESASAKVKGNEDFVLEQHNILLESFNKGTNYRFVNAIAKKIKQNKELLSYRKAKRKGFIFCIMEPLFYKKIINKIKRMIKV